MNEVRPGALDDSIDELRSQLQELRASRSRVVAAADTERRRIERALHDGAQQHLVALTVNLQLARRLADSDPAGLKTLLDEIRHDAQEALEDIRRLAWQVYPSLLPDRGLVEALRAAASEAAIPTRVEATGVGRCASEIEAAVYFCCLELLQSAAEHVQAERAVIRIRQEPALLIFEVIVPGDDPDGWTQMDPIAIRDRVGAVGGRLAITSEAGQATYVGTIPIDA